jgi:uncharacterized membrane protein YebE (DUF533 family)
MDPRRLLEQFLGAGAGTSDAQGAQGTAGGLGGIAGGLAAGGLLGLLLGNRKSRKLVGKLAGGVVGYGGAAALGVLGYRAYQSWQAGRGAAETVEPSNPDRFLPQSAPGSDGRPFELALIMAMVAAANADGHIGPDEQRAIFERAGELSLDAEDKAFVFDTLAAPPSLQQVAALARGPEQAAELYLVSRLTIDPDEPAEQAYLEALGSRLGLPADLVEALEQQAREA